MKEKIHSSELTVGKDYKVTIYCDNNTIIFSSMFINIAFPNNSHISINFANGISILRDKNDDKWDYPDTLFTYEEL